MSFLIRIPAVTVTATGLLLAGMVSADAAITGTQAHHPSAPSSAYAVTVTATVGSEHVSVSAHGFADTATHAADLTAQLPGGHFAELLYVDNQAYVHLAAPSLPWLSADPSMLGIPLQVLWAAAATRHFSLKLGPQGDTTVTVTMTPTAMQAVRAPSGAVNLTGNGQVLRLLVEHILGSWPDATKSGNG